jgi:uncharacterized membrane protein YbhN (UPF0104 family)
MRGALFSILRFAITIGAIVWLVFAVDWTNFWNTAKQVALPVLIISYVVYMLYMIPCGLRWSATARISGFRLSFIDAVYWDFIHSFMESFLPLPGSMLLNSSMVAGYCKTSTGSVVGTMLAVRVAGMLASVGFLAVTSVVVIKYATVSHEFLFRVAFFVAGICCAVGLCLFSVFRRVILRAVRWVPFLAFRKFFEEIFLVFDICKARPRQMAGVFGFSLLNQLCFIVSGWILASGIPGFNAPWYSFFFVTPLVFFMSFIPSIGGYGVNQAASVVFFGWFGVDGNVAAVYAIVRLIFGLSTSLIGAIFFALNGNLFIAKETAA